MHLQPMMAIVTNVDNDHLGTHEGDFERLKQSFVDFLQNLPFYGLAIICADDPVAMSLVPRIGRPVVTYGVAEDADFRAINIERAGMQTIYDVVRPQLSTLPVRLNLPGHHNVLNSLAAIAVATELGVSDAAIQTALLQFQGIDRRLQQYGDVDTPAGRVTLIDDYGHHPTEIAATLEAIRQGWSGRRLVLVFQPHRYTRTRDLLDDFARVLANVDALIVTEVYAAGETPIAGADSRAMCRAIRSHGAVEPVYVANIDELPQALARIIRDGDVIVTMGAGSIGAKAAELPQALRNPSLVYGGQSL
jgi:UDP-N-acetylmuramate--alanine ligase